MSSEVAGLGNPNLQQGAFNLNGIPTVGQGATATTSQGNANNSSQQLQAILNKQNQLAAEQKYQQKSHKRVVIC